MPNGLPRLSQFHNGLQGKHNYTPLHTHEEIELKRRYVTS